MNTFLEQPLYGRHANRGFKNPRRTAQTARQNSGWNVGAARACGSREQPIRNLPILPHYQQLTLVRACEMRVSAPVFVRAAAES